MKQSNRHQVQFLAWLEKMSSDLNKAGRLGTARNYRKALNSFSQFLCESGVQSLVWPDESTILKYNSWLQYRGIVRNTISFYMRILRSACNKAAAHGIIPPDQLFSKVYTGVDKTRKRAVDEKLIASLLDMDLSCSHALAMTRDMFIFSYCTRGMAFIDMAMLKQDNIRGDILVYNRKKTGQRLSVRIEDRTREIIERYSRPDSGYIFPILGTSLRKQNTGATRPPSGTTTATSNASAALPVPKPACPPIRPGIPGPAAHGSTTYPYL